LLIYLAPLPLMLAGLALGARAMFAAAGVGALVAGLFAGPSALLLYIVGYALPSAVVVWLGLSRRAVPPAGGRSESSPRAPETAPLSGRAGVDILVGETTENGAEGADADRAPDAWYPHGHIVSWLAALAAVLIVAAAIMLSSGAGFRAAVAEHIEKGIAALLPAIGGGERMPLVNTMIGLFPGWIGVSWVAMGVVNAVAAEAILTRAGRTLRPKPAWADLALPDWLSWALVGAALLALIGPGDVGYTGRNLALALAFPHFLLGLAVAHGLVDRTPHPRALLVGFYVVLFMSAWALLVVAAVGVLEHWIGIRNRLPGGPRPGSNAPEA
jgi:hypothetical protein